MDLGESRRSSGLRVVQKGAIYILCRALTLDVGPAGVFFGLLCLADILLLTCFDTTQTTGRLGLQDGRYPGVINSRSERPWDALMLRLGLGSHHFHSKY